MNHTAYLSLGSNIKDRLEHLTSAVRSLAGDPSVRVAKVSSIYETDPVGYTGQDCFLNIAVEVKTFLSPAELLEKCQSIERELGRKRVIRWGPRTIDLDILLYNHENIETESLSVPHPRMHERAFVLVPLLELNPSLKDPVSQTLLADFLEAIPDKEGVRLWKQKSGADVFAPFES
ncbi:2-amino-4-hydroxy-6-hydroxymethyldihydropteridine diphosphokinase [Peribacillus sp. SCS-37]|uniref:2-amino-4-hydroxy-6- hydroxymethyldihydropteridine diphosphokinase n=1 Tax=Paraperibacillus esterisolvens TaxID=3115296 RepID=UPI003905F8DC